MTRFSEAMNNAMRNNATAALKVYDRFQEIQKSIDGAENAAREGRESRVYIDGLKAQLKQEKVDLLENLQRGYNKGLDELRELAKTCFTPDPTKLTDEDVRGLSYIDLTEDETRAAILKCKQDGNFTLMRALINKAQRLGYDLADDTPEYVAQMLENMTVYNTQCMGIAQEEAYRDNLGDILQAFIGTFEENNAEWLNGSGYTREVAEAFAQRRAGTAPEVPAVEAAQSEAGASAAEGE